MASPDVIARRLSRTRRTSARLRFEDERAFGGEHQVRSWRFGNGLRVLTLVDHGAPVVAYHTWFRVGSRHEVKGLTGLAHFLEHLMFHETANTPLGDFDRRLDDVGAENNAATWADWTYYYENLPAAELPLGIELESDRMTNLVLRDEQITSEREVVASERRDRVDDDVDGKASEKLWHLALGDHPYAHPTIGWMRDILAYTREDCRRFYDTWYAPNNATLILAGDFEEDDALQRIQSAYGRLDTVMLPPEARSRARGQRKERRATLHLQCASDRLVLGYRAPPFELRDWLVLTVIDEILLGGRSGRLYRELVLEKELCQSAWGSLPPFALESLYEIGFTMREGVPVHTALAAVDRHVKRLQKTAVDDETLLRAKNRLELGLLGSMESVNGKADQLGFYETVLEDPTAVFGRLEAYRRIDASDVRRVARAYLEPRRRSVVHVVPK